MRFYWLLLGVLAVWRLTHLLAAEDGPWGLVVRLRRRTGEGFWGELLDCFYCLSLWLAAPLAVLLGTGWLERLLLWPALSAGAVLLERATRREEPAAPPVRYIEEGKEAHDELLWWQKETARGETGPGPWGHEIGAEPTAEEALRDEPPRRLFSLRR